MNILRLYGPIETYDKSPFLFALFDICNLTDAEVNSAIKDMCHHAKF